MSEEDAQLRVDLASVDAILENAQLRVDLNSVGAILEDAQLRVERLRVLEEYR